MPAFLSSYDAPLTRFPSALSGKRTPSYRILRLNFDLPDSRSEKMMGNSQKVPLPTSGYHDGIPLPV